MVNKSYVLGLAPELSKVSLVKISAKQAELSVKPQDVNPILLGEVAITPASPVKLTC